MITVSIDPIRKTIIDTLKGARERIQSEKRQSATSLGIQFDFRFGRMWVALNDDDDESYRCPYFEDFQERNWGFAPFPDLVDLEDKFYELESEEDEPQMVLADGYDHVEVESIEDVCRHLYSRGVQWIQDWFAKQPENQWKPIWLLLNENTSGGHDRIRIDPSRPLPPVIVETEPTSPIQGMPQPRLGTKVYVISYTRDRKYAGLWPMNSRQGCWFVGQSIAHEFSGPIPVKLDPELVRRGDIASFERSIAYLNSGAAHASIASYFDAESQIEKLPLFDGEQNWTAINPLNPVTVIDHSRTLFGLNVPKGAIARVDIAEFDAEALRQCHQSVFKIIETPHLGPFFLEDEQNSGLVSLCQSHQLRGLKFEMIWSEDVTDFITQLEEFMELLRFRVKRLTGTSCIENWKDVECLLGVQKDFWRIGEFREVFRKSGVEAALKQVPGISDLIVSFRPYVPRLDFCGQAEPVSKESIREIEHRFGGTEILNEVRGRLCCYLPRALSSLKEMEATNTGHHAILGPAV
jgi:hypothetical protein